MKTAVEALEGNKVKLSVEVDESEFDKAIDAAFRKIAHEVRIPGFRPGKAPRRVLEARMGKEVARQQALQDALPDYYVRAVEAENVDPIAPPELNITAGTEEGPVAFEATIEVRPTVRVPGYEGLEVTIPHPGVTAEELDAQIDRMRNTAAVLAEVDRQAHPGDHVRIDVAGTYNGQPVDGLTASDYLYELGSKAVVAELDDQLMGSTAGDILEFETPVPDGEEEDRLAFRVLVKAVNEKTLPELTDEWVTGMSEFTTVGALRSAIDRQMGLRKKVTAHLALRDQTVTALVELVDEDPPKAMVDAELQRRLDDFVHRIQHQGASVEQYLSATGQTPEQLVEEMRPAAVNSAKADLALRAVADAEGIEVDEADVAAEIERLARRHELKPKDVRRNLERSRQMPVLRSDVRKTKALTWLLEKVSLVDADGKVIARADLEFATTEDEAKAEAEVETAHDGLSQVDPHADHEHE